ncbi:MULTISPECIES: YaiI/YqxD family protein [Paraliobacillus]|uniref:YaiI/YqxD family protein n=1 Tax=Paraliobacillus TaxID=200903 RepID=UPI000DD371A3|nr:MULTISPECIES: YaiI/YqxD family protein [Paraliobacillus]
MKIYVDADACPVKDIIIKEAKKHTIEVFLVKSYAHFSTQDDPIGVTSVYVDSDKEAADYRIMSMLASKDILITQDYGLASLALEKHATVIHHKGFLYSLENIDFLLETRYQSAQARKSGYRTKGPKAFSNEDRAKFHRIFKELLT